MPLRTRLSIWLVVLGQSATLVAAPIAACCFADPDEMAAADCPHEMTTGAACPMHAAPHHDAPASDTTGSTLSACNAGQGSLTWLQVPVAVPEPPQPGAAAPIDWTSAPTPRLPFYAPPTALPPSPPPRG